jgi:histidyl-tRNA synthetase
MQDVLTKLEVGPFIIKLNHRSILDGVFEVCGVPADQFKAISSAVDKLDKLSWEQVYHEMTQEKHLDPVVAARIGDYVKLNGGSELIGQLEADASLGANAHVQQGCRDLRLLFDYLSAFNVTSGVQFDLSLARGLDYYTGVIYEAVLTQPPTIANDPDAHIPIGSIAAGGRYDNLVGMFSASSGNKKPIKIPCVGLSIGVERVFSILLHKSNVNDIKANACQVYVISVRDGLLKERMAICQQLWEHGISAEFMYKAKPKMQAQFDVCDRDHIPYAVIIGKDEIDNDVVKIKTMKSKIAEEQGGVVMPRSEMVAYLQSKLN